MEKFGADLDNESVEVNRILGSAALVFWDFDGVIKDSVDVKTNAFKNLFLQFGDDIVMRVKHHHESHGGVSRFVKIPLYLGWVGESASKARVDAFCRRFSDEVVQAVIDSPWVPGVREYLLRYSSEQYFVLVTATPKEEIKQILAALDLEHCFREIYGAPMSKSDAIKSVLTGLGCAPEKSLMIGDAAADLHAAQVNGVPFLLRRTPINQSVQVSHAGPTFDKLFDHE